MLYIDVICYNEYFSTPQIFYFALKVSTEMLSNKLK